ncbi:MAG: hypothetical protein JWQ64_2050 [Subtercola sp.]|nr:hypothetical protein [Subtercola sp.]
MLGVSQLPLPTLKATSAVAAFSRTRCVRRPVSTCASPPPRRTVRLDARGELAAPTSAESDERGRLADPDWGARSPLCPRRRCTRPRSARRRRWCAKAPPAGIRGAFAQPTPPSRVAQCTSKQPQRATRADQHGKACTSAGLGAQAGRVRRAGRTEPPRAGRAGRPSQARRPALGAEVGQNRLELGDGPVEVFGRDDEGRGEPDGRTVSVFGQNAALHQ